MEEIEDLKEKLAELEAEHRELDATIEQLTRMTQVDFMQLQRYKKKKLALKDQIQKIKSAILPDIIA
ncbi:MAG: DUF465 domain-containing protein [Alphaproteobacteria bacterium]|jgi:hypothetical protein|nr:DUF465 domain-containing protein [Alphaproteobacteria bacterium]